MQDAINLQFVWYSKNKSLRKYTGFTLWKIRVRLNNQAISYEIKAVETF